MNSPDPYTLFDNQQPIREKYCFYFILFLWPINFHQNSFFVKFVKSHPAIIKMIIILIIADLTDIAGLILIFQI